MGSNEAPTLGRHTDTGLRIKGGKIDRKTIFPENLRLALLLESALVKYRWNKPPYWHLWDRIKSPFGVAVHSFMPGSHQNGISFMRPGIWPAIAIFEPLWQALFNARRLRKPSRLAITSLVHFIVRHELDHSRMWRLPRRVPFS